MKKTAGSYLTYKYSITAAGVQAGAGLYRFGAFPQDRIPLQLTQQTSSNFDIPGTISSTAFIEETNPWFQSAPAQSPDTYVRFTENTTIDKLKSVLY